MVVFCTTLPTLRKGANYEKMLCFFVLTADFYDVFFLHLRRLREQIKKRNYAR